MESWCNAAWDYIGAPWFEGFRDPDNHNLMAVGNGGFSLRKMSSFLRVLQIERPEDFDEPIGLTKWWRHRKIQRFGAFWSRLLRHSNVTSWESYLSRFYVGNEDNFWGIIAPTMDPQFRVPSASVGLGFAFELNPRYCYEKNGERLPFGCHAWAKRGRSFWEEVGVVPRLVAAN